MWWNKQEFIQNLQNKKYAIGIVGLGYVGLPIAYAFAKKYKVIGYDCNKRKIELLNSKIDPTKELPENALNQVNIEFTSDPESLKSAKFIIIAVPTPIDKNKRPDLTALIDASESVGRNLSKGTIVVYESTVYPGVTEDICLPILEKNSNLVYKQDFKIGYSPERINPGDKIHTFENILKVVSGCDQETLDIVNDVYCSVVVAGTYKAQSIKVAEAAKIIENTQRDLNIALMNELAIIFNKMQIDTSAVLEAASTKWNFLKFVPGLVGGHCIGVDPYYLTFKAQEIGYHPEVILAGRRINDNMGKYIAEQAIKKLIATGKTILNSKTLILGLTFKENINDIRNSKVIDIYNELLEYGVEVLVHDPCADEENALEEYNIKIIKDLFMVKKIDCIIAAVAHDFYRKVPISNLRQICVAENPVLIDVKWLFDSQQAKEYGFIYWRL